MLFRSKLVKQKEIKVNVPPGIESGQMIRFSGMGETIEGGVPGDLYVKIRVQKHPTLRKEGYNLVMDIEIKLSQALLGEEKKISTLDSDVTLKIPTGTNTGTILRVRGKGVPMGGSRRGDLYVRVKVQIPEKLNKKEREAIEELKKLGL